MRNRIERMIGRLKNFRRLAARFEKTDQNYLSFVTMNTRKKSEKFKKF